MTSNQNNDELSAPLNIGVAGAGSWGTALADLLGKKGYAVDLWAFEPEVKDQIRLTRENRVFLPGIELSSNIRPTNSLSRAVSGKDLVVVVVPSHVMRETVAGMTGHLKNDVILVSASKGIEIETHCTMSGILQDAIPAELKAKIAVLSGPSFAREVAAEHPTVITVATKDAEAGALVQRVFSTPYFRVYTSDDMIGAELGGAVKNLIAIAAGIIDGMGLGLNTRAALITRGMTEIRRLGLKMGANPRTFTGLAGIGDLVLTCTGNLSRNYTVGYKIGQGRKLAEILSEMRMIAEGVKNARSIYNLSTQLGVEMPISHEVYRILYENEEPKQALYRLMTRELKQELDEE